MFKQRKPQLLRPDPMEQSLARFVTRSRATRSKLLTHKVNLLRSPHPDFLPILFCSTKMRVSEKTGSPATTVFEGNGVQAHEHQELVVCKSENVWTWSREQLKFEDLVKSLKTSSLRRNLVQLILN